MKRLMSVAIACCLAGASAVDSAFAEELSLAVESGTKTLSEALGALEPPLTVADLNGGAYAAYDIRKTGAGTLTFDVDDANFDIANWKGNLYVDGGVLNLIVDSTNAKTLDMLGSQAAGEVYVARGATLDWYSKNTNANSYPTGPKRKVHVAGTGADGMYGAIRLYGAGSGIRAALPWYTILDADATISFQGALQLVSESKTFDLNGKTLTFTKNGNASTCLLVFSSTFLNPGNLVCDGVELQHRGEDKWNGSSANTVTFRNGGNYNWNNSGTVGHKWTLVYEGTANDYISNGNYKPNQDAAVWYGPVSLAIPVWLKSTAYANSGSATEADFLDIPNQVQGYTFNGPVGGAGGFFGDIANTRLCNAATQKFKGMSLALNAANTFTGPLALNGFVLKLGHAEALPADNPNIVLSNTVVRQTVETTDLKTVSFAGESALASDIGLSAAVEADKVTQTDGGTLTVDVRNVEFKELAIDGGTVKLTKAAAPTRDELAGLFYGCHANVGRSDCGYVQIGDKNVPELNYVIYKDYVAALPMDFASDSPSSVFGVYSRAYRTYSGYVWNDSDEDKTWTILSTINSKFRIKVGDAEFKRTSTSSDATQTAAVKGQFTLKPGANWFEMEVGNAYIGWALSAFSGTNNLENWATCPTKNCGLFIDTKGRDSFDIANYEAMASEEAVAKYFTYETLAAMDARRHVGKLTGTGTLDLDGGELAVDESAGTVSVVNGTVRIMSGKTDQDQAFGSGTYEMRGSWGVRMEKAGWLAGRSTSKPELYSFADVSAHVGFTTECLNFSGVTLQPDVFYTAPGSVDNGKFVGWTDSFYHYFCAYQGYLWNSSSAEKSVNVVCTLNSYVQFELNDAVVYQITDATRDPNGTSVVSPWKFAMTLQPGANKFLIRTYDRFGSPAGGNPFLHGNVRLKGLSNWDDAHGLMWSETPDSVDMNDYRSFADAGDGLFVTTEVVPDASYRSLAGGKGTVLDLFKHPLAVQTFAGAAKVTNGDLTVTEVWTMSAAEVVDGVTFLDGATFADGVTFDLAETDVETALKAYRQSGKAGFVIAKNFKGTAPALGPKLSASGLWRLSVEGTTIKLQYVSPGMILLVR